MAQALLRNWAIRSWLISHLAYLAYACAKNYKSQIMLAWVTAKNVGVVFFETRVVYSCIYRHRFWIFVHCYTVGSGIGWFIVGWRRQNDEVSFSCVLSCPTVGCSSQTCIYCGLLLCTTARGLWTPLRLHDENIHAVYGLIDRFTATQIAILNDHRVYGWVGHVHSTFSIETFLSLRLTR